MGTTSSLVNFQNSAAMFVVNTDEQRPGAEELRLASRLASCQNDKHQYGGH